MKLLHEKVRIARVLLWSVAVLVAGLIANTVIINKGGEIVRGYDLWLLLFSRETYAGQSFIEIFARLGTVGIFTVVLAIISLGVGWLTGAIVGSLAVLLRKRA